MPNTKRTVAFVLAVIAGVCLLASGIHGPIGTYQLIIDQMPQFIQNQQVLQITTTVALILITISLAGGLAVITGGILLLLNHVSMGRWLISLGAGVGIPWLIMLAITLITAQQVAAVVAEVQHHRVGRSNTRICSKSSRKIASAEFTLALTNMQN